MKALGCSREWESDWRKEAVLESDWLLPELLST